MPLNFFFVCVFVDLSDPRHVEWVRSYLSIWTELQTYIKEHHTTGLIWNKTVSETFKWNMTFKAHLNFFLFRKYNMNILEYIMNILDMNTIRTADVGNQKSTVIWKSVIFKDVHFCNARYHVSVSN